MKNGSTKRTISRVLAFVMLVSAMFTNIISANADVNGVLGTDDVISAASAVIDDVVDSDVEDLSKDPVAPAGVTHSLLYTDVIQASSAADEKQPYTGDDYFTAVGTLKRVQDKDGKISVLGLEMTKGEGSISFTVPDGKTADVQVYAGSTSSSNSSTIAFDGETQTVTGTTKDALTIEKKGLAAGVHTVSVPDTSEFNTRVYAIFVTESAAGSSEQTQPTTADQSQGGGDTDATEWEAHEQPGLPLAQDGTADIKYQFDKGYDGKVKLDIDFTVTTLKAGKGNILRVMSTPDEGTSANQMDHDIALRLDKEGNATLGRNDGGPAVGKVTVGVNHVTFIYDSATNKFTAQLNGGDVVEHINRDDIKADKMNLAGIKLSKDYGFTLDKVTVSTPKEGGAATTDSTTTTTEPASQTTTNEVQTPADGKIKIDAKADKATVDADKNETVKVSFDVSGNSAANGFNNYTVYVNFDPTKLEPVDAIDGNISLGEGFVDAAGKPIDKGVVASNAANIKAQFAKVPKASDEGFEGKGADGAKTQAELGRIKVAYCIYDNGFDAASQGDLPEFTGNGTLFTIEFKAKAPTEEGQPTEISLESGIVDTVSSDSIASTLEVETTPASVAVTGTVTTTTEPDSMTTSEEAPVAVYDHIASKDEKYDDGAVIYEENGAVVKAGTAITGAAIDTGIIKVDSPTSYDGMNAGVPEAIAEGSGNEYADRLKGTSKKITYNIDPSVDQSLLLGKVKDFRSVLEVAAPADKDLDFAIDFVIGTDKLVYMFLIDGETSSVENPGTITKVLYSEQNGSTSKVYRTAKVTIPAGKKAVFAGQGTDVEVYGFDLNLPEPVEAVYDHISSKDEKYDDGAVIYTEDGAVVKAGTAITGAAIDTGAITVNSPTSYDGMNAGVPEAIAEGSGNEYADRLKGTSKKITYNIDPSVDQSLLLGKVKDFRSVLEVAAPADKDLDFAIDFVIGTDKLVYMFLIDGETSSVENPGTITKVLYSEQNGSTSKIYRTAKVTIPAGKKAVFAGQGTDVEVYGFNMTAKASQTPPAPMLVNATNKSTDKNVNFWFEGVNVQSYLVKITYDPTVIEAVDAKFGEGFHTVNNDTSTTPANMLTYPPYEGDSDYAAVNNGEIKTKAPDGTTVAAKLGTLRIGGVADAPVSTSETKPALTVSYKTIDPNFVGEAHINVEVVFADKYTGKDIASATDCDGYSGSILVESGSHVDTSTTTTTTAPVTEPETTPTTSAPRPSGGGGGGGRPRPAQTTTTEAAPEATTAEKTEGVTKDVEGNVVGINPPTVEDPSKGGFIDLDNYGWAQDAIERLARLGIVSGVGDRLFGPSLPCRRCDFAILINRALGLTVSATPKNFYDNVDTSKYYYNDVLIGYNAGILSGYGNNYFKPEQYCTREEMFVLVAKTLEYLGEDVTSTSQDVLNKYVDVADISWWSAPYCAFLTDAGIVTGTPGGYAEPDRYINRAEMAVMINKDYDYALEVLAKQMKTGSQANAELLDEAAEGTDAEAADTEATTVEADAEDTTEETSEADAEATTAEAEAETTTAEAE